MSRQLWLLALPALAILGLFLLLPFVNVMRFATWQWSGVSAPEPVGLRNVGRMLADPELGRALQATCFIALMIIPSFLWLSRTIAIAIEGTSVERPIKALLFLPSLITVGGAAIAWSLLYDPDYGFLAEISNYWLVLPWRSEPWAGLVYISLFILWQSVGYGVLVMSAALKGIPPQLREAARVDGATEQQIRHHIVTPLLLPSTLFLSVIATVLSIQSYTAVFLLTEGAPFGSTNVLGYYLYTTSFKRWELGYGAALTIFMLLITLGVAFLQARFLRQVNRSEPPALRGSP